MLRRIPDLSQLLRNAPPETKRQVFDAFGLQISYDKLRDTYQLWATVTEAVAAVLERSTIIPDDLPGVSAGDRTRLVQTVREPSRRARPLRARRAA